MVVYFKTLCIYDSGFERERLILREREQRTGRLRMKTKGDLPVSFSFFSKLFFNFLLITKIKFFFKMSNLTTVVTET